MRSIRAGEGAVPFPSPAEAAAWSWTDADRALVADRVETQFVGAPATVVSKLEALQRATDADELLITTITHCSRRPGPELSATGAGVGHRVNRYLLRRVGQAVLVLWAAYTLSFLVLYALPGDAIDARFGGDASDVTPEQLQALRAEYGLDRALPLQYLARLGAALTGDLGTSLDNGRPVTSLIAESLPATAAVAGLALLLGIVGGAGLALLAAGSSTGWLSRLPLNLPPLGVAIPRVPVRPDHAGDLLVPAALVSGDR